VSFLSAHPQTKLVTVSLGADDFHPADRVRR
jgi:hypothetical protein